MSRKVIEAVRRASGAYGCGARVLVALVSVALAACASQDAAAAHRGRKADAEIDALYRTIDPAVTRYRDGLKKSREPGARDAGHAMMDEAVDTLVRGGDSCVRTKGCEPQRFMSAYANLLSLRSDELAGDAEGFAEMEPLNGAQSMEKDVPELDRSLNLLNGLQLNEVIKVNGPIKAAMQDWLTWMRPNLISSYEYYQYMRHLMWPAYEEAKFPEALLFGMLAKESGGKVHAVSNAGAAGPFQFMYATGLRFGLGSQDGFDMRYDPAAAARANAAYLNEQLRNLNNNLEFTLAAYNGGEGRMRNLAKQTRARTFWSPAIMNRLPRETQEYVPYVLAAAWLYMHPQEYGLQFPKVNGAPGSVQMQQSMTLNELTICLGQAGDSRDGWFRTLRNLNPRVDPNKRMPAGTNVAVPAAVVDAYARQCVSGNLLQVAMELQHARVPGTIANGGGRKYIVRSGDTLASIARRQRCGDAASLARANNIAAPRYMIKPGQELTLVGCG